MLTLLSLGTDFSPLIENSVEKIGALVFISLPVGIVYSGKTPGSSYRSPNPEMSNQISFSKSGSLLQYSHVFSDASSPQ